MLTRQGWVTAGVAAALVVAGRLLGSVELFVLGAVAGALVLAAALYTGFVRVRVDVGRELHPPRVHAGSPSRVELRVENRGARRSPVLGLRDEVSGTRGAHLGVGPLEPGGSARAAYRLPTERRGVLKVGPLDVLFGDPFGFTRLTLRASGVSELTVFPHVDDVPPIPQTTGNDPMAGADHPNALGRSGEDFYALRPYVVGDDLRRVHWLATARHDELMVRQDELPWQGRATVLLDLRADVHTEATLEIAISAAASLVTASAGRDDLIRLVTSEGTDSGFAAGQGHIEAVLEHLAGVEATPGLALPRVLERLARAHHGGALVLVTGHPPAEDLDAVRRLRRRYGALHLVTVERSAGDPSRAADVPVAGSTPASDVVAVTAAVPFPAAWVQAVGASAARPRPGWANAARAGRDGSTGAPAFVGGAAPEDEDDDRWTGRKTAWL